AALVQFKMFNTAIHPEQGKQSKKKDGQVFCNQEIFVLIFTANRSRYHDCISIADRTQNITDVTTMNGIQRTKIGYQFNARYNQLKSGLFHSTNKIPSLILEAH